MAIQRLGSSADLRAAMRENPVSMSVLLRPCIPVGTLSNLFAAPYLEQKGTPAAKARLTFPQDPRTGLRISARLACHLGSDIEMTRLVVGCPMTPGFR